MNVLQKLMTWFRGKASLKPKGNLQSLNSYKPCILTKKQTRGLSTSDIAKIYEPALINFGVYIPLAEHKPLSFPLTSEEIGKFKQDLCYVWCDGYESSIWEARNCKYIGIRLSESFILHETLCHSEWEWGVHLFSNKCNARLLLLDELRLLNFVWDEVSVMRIAAQDTPLPKESKIFWIKAVGHANDWADRDGNTYHRPTEGLACLLMAVKN